MSIKLIGDVHGKYTHYVDLVKNCDFSIQLGDMGFNYDHMKQLDPACHRFIKGNHDNYDKLVEHDLGDYGYFAYKDTIIFFVRGGFSIDRKYRTIGINFWQDEELKVSELYDAYRLYKNVKPNIVLSHEAPHSIAKIVGNSEILANYGYDPDRFTTKTSNALEQMLEVHRPDSWYFGHYHKSQSLYIDSCNFRCLGELEQVDIL